MSSPSSLTFQVVDADTKQPIADVKVHAAKRTLVVVGKSKSGEFDYAPTDGKGLSKAKVEGEYTIQSFSFEKAGFRPAFLNYALGDDIVNVMSQIGEAPDKLKEGVVKITVPIIVPMYKTGVSDTPKQ